MVLIWSKQPSNLIQPVYRAKAIGLEKVTRVGLCDLILVVLSKGEEIKQKHMHSHTSHLLPHGV